MASPKEEQTSDFEVLRFGGTNWRTPSAAPYDSPPYADEALPIGIQRGDTKIKLVGEFRLRRAGAWYYDRKMELKMEHHTVETCSIAVDCLSILSNISAWMSAPKIQHPSSGDHPQFPRESSWVSRNATSRAIATGELLGIAGISVTGAYHSVKLATSVIAELLGIGKLKKLLVNHFRKHSLLEKVTGESFSQKLIRKILRFTGKKKTPFLGGRVPQRSASTPLALQPDVGGMRPHEIETPLAAGIGR